MNQSKVILVEFSTSLCSLHISSHSLDTVFGRLSRTSIPAPTVKSARLGLRCFDGKIIVNLGTLLGKHVLKNITCLEKVGQNG